jgi:outer membrane protein TolC
MKVAPAVFAAIALLGGDRMHARRSNDRRLGRRAAGAVALLGLLALVGCRSFGEPALHYLGKSDLEHYVDRATSVAAPDVETVAADNIATLPPHTINDRTRDTIRDITLTEAIHLTLANSDIIRERGQFLSPTNPLLNNPEFVTSIYDPAIQETNIQFGNRGVEAALSDFDAQFSTQMLWGREEQVQNSLFGFGQQPGQTLQQDTANFTSRFEKQTATGGTIGVSHTINYDYNNATNRLFPSAYAGNVQAEFRHPLLAGFGVDYNRIAGPRRNLVQGQSVQFTNGVLIARINTDIEVAEFQRAARNVVREAEDAYWNLALAYRVYDADVLRRDSTLRIWRFVNTKFGAGLRGGGTADIAQAKDTYFDAQARVEASRGDLYRRELELRRITGLPVNDGTTLRPIDEPLIGKFTPDWYAALCEALTSRTELRRQKWQIKSLELQLAAANNLARPTLDFISRYRVNGFGDNLLAGSDNDVANTQQGLNSYYNTLLDGNQTGWDLGFEFSLPVGLRAAKSQVRWFELRLMKARASLALMEHEVSHELAAAFQDVDRYYKVAQTNLNRRAAAEERVRAYETRLEFGGISGSENSGEGPVYLDLLLRSQISLADAEISYWQAIIQYNQAIADVHLRQGTLLERDGVAMVEGSWTPEAYQQALRYAWARSHAIQNPLLDSVPDPFAIDGEVLPTALPAPLMPAGETSSLMGLPPAPAPAPMEPAPMESAPLERPAEPELLEPVPMVDDSPDRAIAPTGSAVLDDATPVRPRSPLASARIIRGMNR